MKKSVLILFMPLFIMAGEDESLALQQQVTSNVTPGALILDQNQENNAEGLEEVRKELIRYVDENRSLSAEIEGLKKEIAESRFQKEREDKESGAEDDRDVARTSSLKSWAFFFLAGGLFALYNGGGPLGKIVMQTISGSPILPAALTDDSAGAIDLFEGEDNCDQCL